MLKSNFEFEVLVHGSSAKEYYYKGSYYIEGKEGSNFSLRMRNNSSSKALFIPTVDGLSIISGKEGSFKSQGYIVNAHDSLTIDGWRTSDNKVAQFFFSSEKKSYAKKIKKGGNLGVIGCAVYKEKETFPVVLEKIIKEYIPYPKMPEFPKFPSWPSNIPQWTVYSTQETSQPNINLGSVTCASAINDCSNLNVSGTKLGTGFGEDKYSPVVKVEFDREENVSEVFTLYYNTRKNLEELGIEFRKPVYVAPSAFPNEDGYCKRPD